MNYKKYYTRLLNIIEDEYLSIRNMSKFKIKDNQNHTQPFTERVVYNFVIAGLKNRGTYGKDFIGYIVEIYINGHEYTMSYFNQLLEYKSEIENQLQDLKLFWEESPNKPKTYRIYSRLKQDIEDEDKWKEAIDWQIKTMIKFLEVFPKYVKKLEKTHKILEINMDTENNINNVVKPTMRSANKILYGPPGTGKTYQLKTEAEKYDEVAMVTFHQSYGYEDFVEGLKAKLDNETDQVYYEVENGIFKDICEKAEENSDKNYAIFIDEINRGNISKIFGELITLIESSKRMGASDEIKVNLPYSKKEFGVPQNLSIIGTMNTADRSIAVLDTALRRRFVFEEMMPRYSDLKTDIDGINLQDLLKAINDRIEFLYDRDHTIGHAYFIDCKSFEELQDLFKNRIIPLLQEYFYDDWQKINLIFNDNGFIKTKSTKTKELFSNCKDFEEIEEDKDIFYFDKDAIGAKEEYVKIYNKTKEVSDVDTKS